MNLLTRITATIGATADTAISRFENHDAIAQSALLEARQALAKARIRHQRLQRSVDEIRTQLETAETQAQKWKERAQKLAKTDETRALQCLEQRQICREQVDNHLKNLCKQVDLSNDMANRLKRMELRLQSMTSQRDAMRSRESVARATQVMDRIDHHDHGGVDALFERWELSISDNEIQSGMYAEVTGVSDLQREMDEEERQASLKDELASLIADSEERRHD